MTVSNTQIRVSYATDGTTRAFTIPFPFYLTTDILVLLNGATQNSGYTISGGEDASGNPQTGTCTFATAPASPGAVTLILNVPLTQLVALVDGTAFPSATVNQVNDRAIQAAQRLNDLISRALRAPDGDSSPQMLLPTSSARANLYLAFDGFGNPQVTAGSTGTALTQGNVGLALYPQTSGETSAGVTPSNYGYPELWVERYGADPTGVADSGVAFRAACSVASAKGGGIIRAYGSLYNFTTWDTSSFYATNNLALFCLPANTELAGGGMFFTRLRISQTARTGMYNAGANRTHIIGMRSGQGGQYVHDLEFDWNGIAQQSATDYCYHVRTNSGDCIIERCYATQAPITNGIVDASTDSAHGNSPLGPTIVRDCWFQDSGPNMTGNGVNADLSYIYLAAPGSRAERNLLYNTAIASHNCGGIEMHASRYYAVGNYIKNCWPGMYIGVGDGSTISVGSVVDRNYIGYCNAGIQVIDQHTGLKITKNHFEANADSSGTGFGYAFTDLFTPLNSSTGANSAGVQTALSVVDNTFDCTLYRQGTARSSAGTAGQQTSSVNFSALLGCQISDNRFINPTPNCISIQVSTGNPTQDVVVERNKLINCNDIAGTAGYINVNASTASSYSSGPIAQDVYIRNNSLWRSRSLSQSNAFLGLLIGNGASPASALTNVRFESNDAINVNPLVYLISTLSTDVLAVNGQNPQAQGLSANGQTIKTAGYDSVIVTSSGAFTGLILQAGTYAGQKCRVINQNSNAQTMAASGTSNVADGTSCVIPASRSMLFTWDTPVNLWYHD